MQTETFKPILQSQRIAIVDILRGWALLGVVLMNYADAFYLGLDDKYQMDTAAKILQGVSGIIFAAKSWTMLSFLFGYGFAVLMENVAAKGINPYGFFSRRMFWLLVIAFINSSFFFGDILKDYAVMGMVLLLFYRSSAKTALYISITLLLLTPAVAAYTSSLKMPSGMALLEPYFPLFKSGNILDVLWFGLIGTYKYEILSPSYLVTVHVVMLCCFFLGLAAQKAKFFSNLAENKKYVKRIFWSSLAVAIGTMVMFGVVEQLKIENPFRYYRPGYFIILSSMLFFTASLCWLYIAGKLKGFFSALQVIGKMTLTNYIVQNFLALLLFSGIGLGFAFERRIHFGYYLLFAFVIYVVQIFFSKWWLSKYYYGPIEWAWRQLSYGKRLPLKRK